MKTNKPNLIQVRCPQCKTGYGIDHGNRFECGTCEGTASVWVPALIIKSVPVARAL